MITMVPWLLEVKALPQFLLFGDPIITIIIRETKSIAALPLASAYKGEPLNFIAMLGSSHQHVLIPLVIGVSLSPPMEHEWACILAILTLPISVLPSP